MNVEVQKGCSLIGNFRIEGDLIISGKVSGEIEVEGCLKVEKDGIAEGKIKSKGAVIAGKLNGEIQSCEAIEIVTGAVISGKIVAKEVFFTTARTEKKDEQIKKEEYPAEEKRQETLNSFRSCIPLVTGMAGKVIVKPRSILKSDNAK